MRREEDLFQGSWQDLDVRWSSHDDAVIIGGCRLEDKWEGTVVRYILEVKSLLTVLEGGI